MDSVSNKFFFKFQLEKKQEKLVVSILKNVSVNTYSGVHTVLSLLALPIAFKCYLNVWPIADVMLRHWTQASFRDLNSTQVCEI